MRKTSLEKLANKIYRTPEPPAVLGQKYAWVFGFTEKGRKVVDGPFPMPIGADQPPIGAEASLAEFSSGEIFVLRTKNMARAKSEIKHRLLERGEDPDEALQRVLKKKEETIVKKKRHYLFPKF